MFFRWLKRYMPRSLYARAALILAVPMIVVLLAVSVAFLQRHLEDVTKQMTLTVIRELQLIASVAERAETQQEFIARARPLLGALQIRVRFVDADRVPAEDRRSRVDYTGHVVIETLHESLPATRAVVLENTREATIYVTTGLGPVELLFDRRRLSPAAPHQLIVTMLFFAVLMTWISFLYMRNQLRPIMRLAAAADAFGHGNAVPYTPSGATEVRVAGHAFLDMRNRIERQIEQRTLMLSGVSHDMRTPLTRMRLTLAMMDEDEAAPLLQDVDEMQGLLDAFLDFARNASEGVPERVDPVALVTQAVADAQRAGHAVELVDSEGEGEMMLRPLDIRRAVENLIGNAVRYGNRAEVSLALTPRFLRIRVEDDGPGIPADQRTEAVKPFSRLDPARNQNRGSGVGLGLAIVADTARAHGGALRLGESGRLGGLCADIVIGR
ncbi:ATP-binding protein [Lutimaribacter marinistellae]|uniref:histidine kinase n=1 Tax=Lutimaribacter marinistellae TaxID=1820329 RepID=A0ABV7TKM5_9RHOB